MDTQFPANVGEVLVIERLLYLCFWAHLQKRTELNLKLCLLLI